MDRWGMSTSRERSVAWAGDSTAVDSAWGEGGGQGFAEAV